MVNSRYDAQSRVLTSQSDTQSLAVFTQHLRFVALSAVVIVALLVSAFPVAASTVVVDENKRVGNVSFVEAGEDGNTAADCASALFVDNVGEDLWRFRVTDQKVRIKTGSGKDHAIEEYTLTAVINAAVLEWSDGSRERRTNTPGFGHQESSIWVLTPAHRVLAAAWLEYDVLRVQDGVTSPAAETYIEASHHLLYSCAAIMREQVIEFVQPDDRYVHEKSFSVTVSASSGLAVILASLTAEVCTTNADETVDLHSAGTCTLVASQSGNDEYARAADVTRSFLVIESPSTTTTTVPVTTTTVGTTVTTVPVTTTTIPAPSVDLRMYASTEGTNPAVVDMTPLAPAARITVSVSLGTIRGLAILSLKDGHMSVVATKGFSGIIRIPLTVDVYGVLSTASVIVVVNPLPPEAVYETEDDTKRSDTPTVNVIPRISETGAKLVWIDSPRAAGHGKVSWEISANAIGYEVWRLSVLQQLGQLSSVFNLRVLLCSTIGNTCDVPNLLGPLTRLEVVALGHDNTRSTTVLPTYGAVNPIPVLRVMFAANSSVLTATARRELNRLVGEMVREGFDTVYLDGHAATSQRNSFVSWLANERNRAVAAYMLGHAGKPLLVRAKNNGGMVPVRPNTFERNRSHNRRVEVRIHVGTSSSMKGYRPVPITDTIRPGPRPLEGVPR